MRARKTLDWSQERLAAELGRDPSQVAKWERGDERTQVDTVYGCSDIRGAFASELAKLGGAKVWQLNDVQQLASGQVLVVFRKAG